MVIIFYGNKGNIIPVCKSCGQKMLHENSNLNLWKCPDCKKVLKMEGAEFFID